MKFLPKIAKHFFFIFVLLLKNPKAHQRKFIYHGQIMHNSSAKQTH